MKKFTLLTALFSVVLASNTVADTMDTPVTQSVKSPVDVVGITPVSTGENKVDKTLQGIEVTVNINQASTHELATLLTGVGEKKAQSIVEYRELNGPFTSVDSLMEVKGIGPALLAKNRQRIIL